MNRLVIALVALLSSFLGGLIVWVFQGHSLRVVPAEMSYSDFVAIILSVLSALLGIFGIGLALVAFWGVSAFRKGVQLKIEEIAPLLLRRELKEGGSRQILDNLVNDFFRAELASPGMAEAWAAERDRQSRPLEDLDKEPIEDLDKEPTED